MTERQRVKTLLAKIAEASKSPNNQYHQYQINRDFGFLLGIKTMLDITDEIYINHSELDRLLSEVEQDYKERSYDR